MATNSPDLIISFVRLQIQQQIFSFSYFFKNIRFNVWPKLKKGDKSVIPFAKGEIEQEHPHILRVVSPYSVGLL